MTRIIYSISTIMALTAIIFVIPISQHIASANSCSASVDSHAGLASFKSSSSHGGCAAGGASFGSSPTPGVAFADSGGKSHRIAEIGSATGTFGTAFRGCTVYCKIP